MSGGASPPGFRIRLCAMLNSEALLRSSVASSEPTSQRNGPSWPTNPPAVPALPPPAGNSSLALGEGADMANVALAAAVNLPKLAEQVLAKQGEDASKNAALLSAAAAVASAASALAASRQQLEDDGEVHTPEEVQAMLEEEMEAMQRLLDGR